MSRQPVEQQATWANDLGWETRKRMGSSRLLTYLRFQGQCTQFRGWKSRNEPKRLLPDFFLHTS